MDRLKAGFDGFIENKDDEKGTPKKLLELRARLVVEENRGVNEAGAETEAKESEESEEEIGKQGVETGFFVLLGWEKQSRVMEETMKEGMGRWKGAFIQNKYSQLCTLSTNTQRSSQVGSGAEVCVFVRAKKQRQKQSLFRRGRVPSLLPCFGVGWLWEKEWRACFD